MAVKGVKLEETRPRQSRASSSTAVLAYVLLILGSIVMFFPFLWMLISSFKDIREILGFNFFPQEWTLANYREVIFDTNFPRWFFNSLVVALATTASVLFFCSLVGYTLTRMRFPGRQFIFILILSTLMVPTEMLVIPWFVMSSQAGWVNTFWGIAFPGLIPAFGVFLMRQFFQTLPRDLFDAARVDGLSEFGLFWRIGLPLVRPALAALGIFAFHRQLERFFVAPHRRQSAEYAHHSGRDCAVLRRVGHRLEPDYGGERAGDYPGVAGFFRVSEADYRRRCVDGNKRVKSKKQELRSKKKPQAFSPPLPPSLLSLQSIFFNHFL